MRSALVAYAAAAAALVASATGAQADPFFTPLLIAAGVSATATVGGVSVVGVLSSIVTALVVTGVSRGIRVLP